MSVDHDRLLFDIENYLIQYGAPIYVHFFLRFNYDKIRDGEVTMILAPSDEVMQRLSTQANKSLNDISTIPEGIDFLNNFLSSTPIGEQFPVYLAINGTTFGHTTADLRKLNVIVNNKFDNIFDPKFGNIAVSVIGSGIRRNQQQMDRLASANSSQGAIPRSNIIGENPVTEFDDLPNPIIRQIALSFSPSDITELCRLSTWFNLAICESDDFWNEKTRYDHPKHHGKINNSWKDTYRMTGRLYTFGEGYGGKLGHSRRAGPNEEQLKPKLVEALNKVSYVSCGENHTAVISDGQLYTFGYRKTGSRLQHVTLAEGLNNVTVVSVGADYTHAISNGQLYKYQQIDYRMERTHKSRTNQLERVNFPSEVTFISDASNHSALISNGRLYTEGYGQYGQLGQGEGRDVIDNFMLVEELDNVTDVSCGGVHTATVSNGQLYTFGNGAAGMLGHGDVQNQSRPKLVEGLSNVTSVSCGLDHTAVISNGRLYTFGSGYKGQLGHDSWENYDRPKLVENLDNVTFVSCGRFYTAAISNGRLYTFGNNSYGQLGHGDRKEQTQPKLVESLGEVSFVSCGYNNTAVITG